MSPLRVGIIGAGRIGRLHAENLTRKIPGVEVVAVADVVEEAARSCAGEFGIPHAYKEPTPIFEDRGIDAVLICTSTDTHAELIERAAVAGKHIFCEKPIALDLAAIDRALEAVKKAGVVLQIGFHRRFDPSFRGLKEALAGGAIGRPWLLKITSYDPAPPPLSYIRVSGGIFLDMAIHDFDMARFLLGEVEEVYAAGSVLVDPEIGRAGDVDTAITTLRFESGALGVITNSRRATYGHDQRIEVLGEKGGLFADNPLPRATVAADEKGYHSPPLYHFFMDRYREAYVAEMEAFVEAVKGKREPPVTGLDGKIPVVMGYAAQKSLEEGRPVRLSEIDPTL